MNQTNVNPPNPSWTNVNRPNPSRANVTSRPPNQPARHRPFVAKGDGARRDERDDRSTTRPSWTTATQPRPAVFWTVVAATVAIGVIAALSSTPEWLSAVIVVAVIAGLGIPHGAVDHLVNEAIDERRGGKGSQQRFLVAYGLAMACVGLVWLAAPPLALGLFFVLSVHHFGQSDLAYLRLGGPRQLVVQWSRGLFLVGLPLVAHLAAVAPVLERLGGVDVASWTRLIDAWWLWAALLIGQHVAVGAAIAGRIDDRSTVAREAVSLAALTLLLLAADPLIGFAVYFGLWHSLGHLRVLADVLGSEPYPIRSLARLAAPFTAVSLLGMAVGALGVTLAGRADLLVPVVFVFVSMLTLPHMVVVERLWRSPRAV